MYQPMHTNYDRKIWFDERNHGPVKTLNAVYNPKKYHWEQDYTQRKSDSPYFYWNLPPPSMQSPQNDSRPPGVETRRPVGSPMGPRGPIGMGFGQRGPNPKLDFFGKVSYEIKDIVWFL